MSWLNYTTKLKPKDMVPIPWMVAMALQADGWYLRSDIIWAKPNPMPESVTDRPTKSHEYLFLLSKSATYYYDAEAIKEPMALSSLRRLAQPFFDSQTGGPKDYATQGINVNRSARRTLENLKEKYAKELVWSDRRAGWALMDKTHGRNRRSVWVIPTQPYRGAHFATFPEKLVEPCILAGCQLGGVVLDPFVGSGTVCAAAARLGRRGVGVDLKPEYLRLAVQRISGAVVAPLHNKQGRGPRQYAGFNAHWRQRGRRTSLLDTARRLAARWR